MEIISKSQFERILQRVEELCSKNKLSPKEEEELDELTDAIVKYEKKIYKL